jgi:hypothetical protein
MVTSKEFEANIKSTLAVGEEFASSSINEIDENELIKITKKLIMIYEYLINDDEIREKAFQIVCKLGKNYAEILDVIIDSAIRYNQNQKIEDADPYNPNSYDVLANIGNEKVISYLRETVKVERGIPRYEAIKSLCKVNDSLADRFLLEMVSGKRLKDIASLDQYEFQTISRIKGEKFFEGHIQKSPS